MEKTPVDFFRFEEMKTIDPYWQPGRNEERESYNYPRSGMAVDALVSFSGASVWIELVTVNFLFPSLRLIQTPTVARVV